MKRYRFFLWLMPLACLLIGCDDESNTPSNLVSNTIQVGLDMPINTTFGVLENKGEVEQNYSYQLSIYAGIDKEQLESNISVTTPVAVLFLNLYCDNSSGLTSGIYPFGNTGSAGTILTGKVIYYPNGTENGKFDEYSLTSGSLSVR